MRFCDTIKLIIVMFIIIIIATAQFYASKIEKPLSPIFEIKFNRYR